MNAVLSRFRFVVLTLCLVSGIGAAAEKLVVQSVNYPLHYFAERLATDSFDVRYLVDLEVDPAFWNPTDDDLVAFQQADLIIRNGADYAKWMDTVTLPRSIMLDTSKGFSAAYLESGSDAHQHGEDVDHSHGGTAFTTWIDFKQAIQQAEAIADRFKELRPEEAELIQEKFESLSADLLRLDGSLKAFGAAWGDRPLLASHPIYQYLDRAYGLNIEALEWEPEMELNEAALQELKAARSSHPAEWMVWEGTATDENVAALELLGISSVVFSPCANRPVEGDWLVEMRRNIKNLEGLLAGQ
tara:strand:+ start:203 stop:1102 length:900 start_codon:yes stop_codon:yes gene_type:complete